MASVGRGRRIVRSPAHRPFVKHDAAARRVTNEDMVEKVFRLRTASHCRKLICGPVIRGVVIWIQRKSARGRCDHLDITTTRERNVAKRRVGFRIVGIERNRASRIRFRHR